MADAAFSNFLSPHVSVTAVICGAFIQFAAPRRGPKNKLVSNQRIDLKVLRKVIFAKAVEVLFLRIWCKLDVDYPLFSVCLSRRLRTSHRARSTACFRLIAAYVYLHDPSNHIRVQCGLRVPYLLYLSGGDREKTSLRSSYY